MADRGHSSIGQKLRPWPGLPQRAPPARRPDGTETLPYALIVSSSDSGRFEQGFGQFRLANNAEQRTSPHWIVKRDRDRQRCAFHPLLHDPVTGTLADCNESALFENLTNLRARKDSKPTQPEPRPASRTLRSGSAGRPRKRQPSRRIV